jgi:hypothetical protein
VDLSTLEREMLLHPTEAINIARRASDGLQASSDAFKRVFAKAAEVQEKRLGTLSEAQVTELASVHLQTLADPPSARRVQENWLKARERMLADNDGPGRLAVARLWFRWLRERAAAARLCQEALRVAPDLVAAEQMLRDDLRYRLVRTDWVADPQGPAPLKPAQVRPGMTAAEVVEGLGQPQRIARQVLFRRFLEQWSYDTPPGLVIEFDCLKGQDSRVLTVHSPPARP